MNVAEIAVKSLQEAGERVSVIFEGQEITNAQMDRVARKLGNALKKLGVEQGDRVILQMPNCPEVLQSFQAIWKIGAVVVPINYLVGAEEISYIYKDSGRESRDQQPGILGQGQECDEQCAGDEKRAHGCAGAA